MRRSILAAAVAAFVGFGLSATPVTSVNASEGVELPDLDWQHGEIGRASCRERV